MDEHDAKRLDIGITMAVATLTEALGMHWENVERRRNRHHVRYRDHDFRELINRNGCHWNEVIGRWGES